jgi:hypothetical protein
MRSSLPPVPYSQLLWIRSSGVIVSENEIQVIQCNINTIPILIHQMHISTNQVNWYIRIWSKGQEHSLVYWLCTSQDGKLLSYGLRIKDLMARHEEADVIIIQRIDWLIIHWFTSHARIFHLYGDVSITGKGLQNLGLCLALRAFEQGGNFIVQHLLWHGTSIFQSHPKDHPIQSHLTTHKGMLRIDSYLQACLWNFPKICLKICPKIQLWKKVKNILWWT